MLLLRQARLSEGADPSDLIIDAGVVRAVAPAGSIPDPGQVLDVEGALVVPGLHDHHVHLRSWAASLASVEVGPPAVVDPDGLARALSQPGEGWLRAVGYHQSVAGELDRWNLDRLVPHRPVRVQHRSGAIWILNSRGLDELGTDLPGSPGVERDRDGLPTGRLFRMDDWLAGRLPGRDQDTSAISALASGWGVTGFTEAGPEAGPPMLAWLEDQKRSGRLAQRLLVMAPSRGAGSDPPTGSEWAPVKFLLDDTDLPGLVDLTDRFAVAHRRGLPVAVHCVTVAQLWLALTALADTVPLAGDRVEHGALIPEEAIARLAAGGIAVVTNPGLVRHRGDQYRLEVGASDQADLYRAATLRAGGVVVAGGTDAPFGPADPWESVRAAVDRRTLSGHLLGPQERLDAVDALGLFLADPRHLGRRRRVEAGAAADLCVLRAGRLSDAVTGADPVAVTIIGGEIVYGA
jgi:predicted amidohydrolase YtcJ